MAASRVGTPVPAAARPPTAPRHRVTRVRGAPAYSRLAQRERHAGATHAAAPYVDLDRRAWSRLRESHPMSLEQSDLARLRGLGDRLDLNEVQEVYLPALAAAALLCRGHRRASVATTEFLGERPTRGPFVVGVAGSVAVGKSTTSRILQELMSRWPHTPRVELITTDGFLHRTPSSSGGR